MPTGARADTWSERNDAGYVDTEYNSHPQNKLLVESGEDKILLMTSKRK